MKLHFPLQFKHEDIKRISAINYANHEAAKKSIEDGIKGDSIVCSCCLMAEKQLFLDEFRGVVLHAVAAQGSGIVLLKGDGKDAGIYLRNLVDDSTSSTEKEVVFQATRQSKSSLEKALKAGAQFVVIPGDADNHIELSDFINQAYKDKFSRLDLASFAAIYYSVDISQNIRRDLCKIVAKLDMALSVLDVVDMCSHFSSTESLIGNAYRVAQLHNLIETSDRLDFKHFNEPKSFLLAVPVMRILTMINQKKREIAIHETVQFILNPESFFTKD